MRRFWLFPLLMMFGLFFSACQTGFLGGSTAAPTAATTEETVPYPLPAGPTLPAAYPPAEGTPQDEGLYPLYESGSEILWEQAVSLIQNGAVTKVVQTHDLLVNLTLKDGRTFITTEPSIDEVMKVINACGDPCKGIQIATE